ncbi:MAG TPA: tryptophan--tRNA ligase, partial [Candidatus Nanoarchaeia archaeon]|nr:tryptophan--tRNA ligase [Candidatus Nanoarchaeia archaeon]
VKLMQLSSTYHTFVQGLAGGKMSSSDPNSFIALTDDEKTVKTKVNRYAFSGGRDTMEEHRRLGGVPEIDVAYQWLTFFEDDDRKLQSIYDDYKSGKMLSGELKAVLIEKLNHFLADHQKKREKAKSQVEKFVAMD